MNIVGTAELLLGYKVDEKTAHRLEKAGYAKYYDKKKLHPLERLFKQIYHGNLITAIIGYQVYSHMELQDVTKINIDDLEKLIEKFTSKLEELHKRESLRCRRKPSLYLYADSID